MAGYITQVAAALVGLWMTPFLLRHVGQHDYGLWLVGLQTLGYVGLLDLGVIGLLQREAAHAAGRDLRSEQQGARHSGSELPELVGRVTRIAVWQMPLMVAAAVLIWLWNPGSWAELRGPLAVVIAGSILLYPTHTLHATLVGLQDLGFLNTVASASLVLTSGIAAVLVLRGAGLYSLAIAYVVSQIALAAAWGARLQRKCPRALPRRVPQVSWAAARSYLSKSTWLTVSIISNILLAGTDLLIIAKLLGPAAVVPYACTAKLLQMATNQPQLLIETALPGLSHLRSAEGRSRMGPALIALTQGVLLVSGAVATVVLAVNRSFVGWWVGNSFFSGMPLTVALILALILRHWKNCIGMAVFSFGHERRLALLGIAEGLLSVGLSVLLTLKFGLLGIVIGGIAAMVLVSVPVFVTTLARELHCTALGLLRPLYAWSLRLTALLVAAALFGKFVDIRRFAPLAVASFACVVIYAVVMWSVARSGALGPYSRPLIDAFMRRLRFPLVNRRYQAPQG